MIFVKEGRTLHWRGYGLPGVGARELVLALLRFFFLLAPDFGVGFARVAIISRERSQN